MIHSFHSLFFFFFFFNDTATTEIYTLSLHDALPILHAHHNGGGRQDAGNARDGHQHAPDEGVHHLQRRDIDHDAAGARARDALGQVVLERQRRLVLHVDLDGNQQHIAHAQDWNAVHGWLTPVSGG